MAKQKALFITNQQIEVINSYWCIQDFVCRRNEKYFQFTLQGYASKIARENGAAPLGERTYVVFGDEFDALYSRHVGPEGPNLMRMMYEVVDLSLDLSAPTPEDPERMIGFFDGDTNVF